ASLAWIAHGEGLDRSHAACDTERIRTTRQHDDVRSNSCRKLRQQQSKKTSTDDRDAFTGGNACALEDIHDTPERLPGEWQLVELSRKRHDCTARCKVVFRIRVSGDEGHSTACRDILHIITDSVDDAPTFVSRRTRLPRILEPGTPLPYSQIGRTHAATFQQHAH